MKDFPKLLTSGYGPEGQMVGRFHVLLAQDAPSSPSILPTGVTERLRSPGLVATTGLYNEEGHGAPWAMGAGDIDGGHLLFFGIRGLSRAEG